MGKRLTNRSVFLLIIWLTVRELYPDGAPVIAEGKRGHVVVDQRSAHTIRSELDMAVANYLATQELSQS